MFFGSCSKSEDVAPVSVDSNPVVASNFLVSKIITTSVGQTETENITYIGNKLVEIAFTNGEKTKFTYTGNLITKIEEFDGTTLNSIETLNYNIDGKLSSYLEVNYFSPLGGGPTGRKVEYTYDTAGNILFTTFDGSATSQTNQYSTGKAIITQGQITKIEEYIPANTINNSPAYTATETITYDDKIFSGINVMGFNKITMQGTELGFYGAIHNILTVTKKNGAVLVSTDDSTYTYNSSNFPITENNISKSYNANGQVLSTISLSNQIFY